MMPRILVLNNYSLSRVAEEVEARLKPDHHLFGVNRLSAAGFAIEVVPFQKFGFLRLINRVLSLIRFPVAIGDLDQQLSAWLSRNDIGLVYSPCQTQTQLLSYLRAIGLFHAPIITIAHHPINSGRLRRFRRFFIRWQIRGTDAFPSLSAKVARQLNEIANLPCYSPVMQWGPDLDYYPVAKGYGSIAVAAGRTGRDFVTFGKAATLAGTRTKIICLAQDRLPEFAEFAQNVQVQTATDESAVSYRELCAEFASARVLAVPLCRGESLAGLTSLTDALGIGRPVIMTRHPLIDLDIEKEGIGKWVDCEDVSGWAEALRWFEKNPEKACEMGRRARVIAERRWNSKKFAEQLIAVINGCLSQVHQD
jgi:glycosyltransferase involved in cell wall biosynthesis